MVKHLKKVGIIILICLLACGCGVKDNENNQENGMRNEITEREVQILKDCGFSSAEIAEMKKDGIPKLTEMFLDNAEEVLSVLNDKYGLEFRVFGGEVPSALSSEYEFYVYANEGELAGQKFVVSVIPGEDSAWTYEEGYYGLLIANSLENEIEDFIKDEDINLKVFAYSECQVTTDYTVEDRDAFKERIVYVECFIESSVDTETFENLSKRMEDYIRENGYWVSFSSYRVSEDTVLDSLTCYSDIHNIYNGDLYDKGLCDLYYTDGIVEGLGE